MTEPPALSTIRERVKGILRRDLKLGDVPIADDMAFFSSETDFDSLDILLLVTSIEREFGIKVASEEVGRSAFQNVDTLTRFIHERCATGAPAPASASAGVATNYLEKLPHAEPFRFVSRVIRVTDRDSAEGVWALSGSEAFFAGHFPNQPIVPGVLIAEALAQLSGLIVGRDSAGVGKLAHVDVRFEQAVAPPVQITLKSKLLRQMGQLQQFEVAAGVADVVIARGTLTLHIADRGSAAQTPREI